MAKCAHSGCDKSRLTGRLFCTDHIDYGVGDVAVIQRHDEQAEDPRDKKTVKDPDESGGGTLMT